MIVSGWNESDNLVCRWFTANVAHMMSSRFRNCLAFDQSMRSAKPGIVFCAEECRYAPML